MTVDVTIHAGLYHGNVHLGDFFVTWQGGLTGDLRRSHVFFSRPLMTGFTADQAFLSGRIGILGVVYQYISTRWATSYFC